MSKLINERSSRSRQHIRAALAVALLGSATVAMAGLYPPAAPPGSAFIRVFNATSQPKVTAQVGSKDLGSTAAMEASSYQFLPPGQYTVKIGGASQGAQLQGSHCYTAVLEGGNQVHLFDQPCFNSQLKALVAVYNMVDGSTLSLRTSDGQKVIDQVAANASGEREVNPVKASLAVYDGSTKLADAKPVMLSRGSTYSLFVTGTRSSPVLIWING
jgi:alginate O-acetyltransferase complex protein AlgF